MQNPIVFILPKTISIPISLMCKFTQFNVNKVKNFIKGFCEYEIGHLSHLFILICSTSWVKCVIAKLRGEIILNSKKETNNYRKHGSIAFQRISSLELILNTKSILWTKVLIPFHLFPIHAPTQPSMVTQHPFCVLLCPPVLIPWPFHAHLHPFWSFFHAHSMLIHIHSTFFCTHLCPLCTHSTPFLCLSVTFYTPSTPFPHLFVIITRPFRIIR